MSIAKGFSKTVLGRFIDYSEINTKIACVYPFGIAILFCIYNGYPINKELTLLFFLAMLLFDMATTMINNHIDRKQEGKEGYFSHSVELAMIVIFVLIAGAIGLVLTMTAGLVFLLVGILCFMIGINYTFGPFPISRSPYSEVVSGLFEGFAIPFLVVTLNSGSLLTVMLQEYHALIIVDMLAFFKLGLVCLPAIVAIANIMLANNICDYEVDKQTRYTLVRHIGIKHSLRLFTFLYVVAYGSIVVAVFIKAVPWPCLLTLLSIPLVIKNLKIFYKKQVKSETFIVAIKNFIVILTPYAVSLMVVVLL